MTAEPQAGQVLHGMQLTECLGEGGLGTVWKAEYLGAPVAVKFLKGTSRRHTLEMEAVGQYRLGKESAPEARYFARIEHYQPEEPHPCVRMEYIEGEDLSRALARGALPLERALTIMEHLLRAMAFAHEKGFVHGDMKPSNIILTTSTDTPVKIIDCGFGYALDRTLPPDQLRVSFERSVGSISLGVSTSLYAAPERFSLRFLEELEVAQSCDVYSLGRIFYQLLSGEQPANVFPLAVRVPGVTPSLDLFLAGCVQNRWEGRWRNAREALEGLQAARQGASVMLPQAGAAPSHPESFRDELCARCSWPMPPDVQFCPSCGEERARVKQCRLCKWQSLTPTRYCGRCGALLQSSGFARACLWIGALFSLLSALACIPTLIIDLVENPCIHRAYYGGIISMWSDDDFVAGALVLCGAWFLLGFIAWALSRRKFRRPFSLLPWSCLAMMPATVLSAFCLADSAGGDHSDAHTVFLCCSGGLALIGFLLLCIEKRLWRRRWTYVATPVQPPVLSDA